MNAQERGRALRHRLSFTKMMKRAIDIFGAFAGIVIFAPVMIAIAVAIKVNMGGEIFFRQMRPGLHGKPFRLIKFRTMTRGYNSSGNSLEDGERITSLGRLLRNASLDELPELWNVLVGDMSLVGPRPLLMQYLPLYTSEQARRHDVRPGLTGWAQINGRNALTWEMKFALDVWYVNNNSLFLDAKIIALTAIKVVRREGISAVGEATMPLFVGNRGEGR